MSEYLERQFRREEASETKRRARQERNAAIVDHFRASRNLQKTGDAYRVTREYVRQVVAKHKWKTGEIIEPGYGRGEIRVERVVWQCYDCGQEDQVIPSKSWKMRCADCARKHRLVPKSPHSAETIENWIARKRAGESWLAIGLTAGMSPNGTHGVARLAWRHLIRAGRLSEIDEIWPPGVRSRRWLRPHTPVEYRYLCA